MDSDELQMELSLSEIPEEKILVFQSWRGEKMQKIRLFVGETQSQFGARLDMTQQTYAKFEKPRGWKTNGQQIIDLLDFPTAMLQSVGNFENFIKEEGAKTFVRLIEKTMECWTLPDGDAFADAELPVSFIITKMGSQIADEWRRTCVKNFLADPTGGDLDQEVKRWLESVLELEPGSISDPNFHESRIRERKSGTNKIREIFVGNVKQLLVAKNWTAAKLAADTGIPLSEIVGDSENIVFNSFFMRHLVAVATVFQVPAWKLLMERGTEVERESAAAFSELPDYVRWVISFIYSAVKEEVNGIPTAGAQTVTGLLPVLVGVLKYAQQEAIRNPKLVDTARTLLTAFAPEVLTLANVKPIESVLKNS